MNALEIRNLTKKYKGFLLDEISLTLPSGCIMGLIGENGAGKSTTMQLILDNVKKDSGEVVILGNLNTDNISETKQYVGVVTDNIGIPDCLTTENVAKIMEQTYVYWNQKEFESLVKRLAIPEGKQFRHFSRGMKLKLGIAIALSHGSKLLLLDEPTAGLDPVIRDELLELLIDFTRDEEHSVLISSHIVSDLEKLCDYVAFLHQGKLVVCDEKDRLLERYGILRLDTNEADSVPYTAVVHERRTSYGVELLVRREKTPSRYNVSAINVEELFVLFAKEGVIDR